MSVLLELPGEVYVHIFGYCGAFDLSSIALVNRRLSVISRSDVLWRGLVDMFRIPHFLRRLARRQRVAAALISSHSISEVLSELSEVSQILRIDEAGKSPVKMKSQREAFAIFASSRWGQFIRTASTCDQEVSLFTSFDRLWSEMEESLLDKGLWFHYLTLENIPLREWTALESLPILARAFLAIGGRQSRRHVGSDPNILEVPKILNLNGRFSLNNCLRGYEETGGMTLSLFGFALYYNEIQVGLLGQHPVGKKNRIAGHSFYPLVQVDSHSFVGLLESTNEHGSTLGEKVVLCTSGFRPQIRLVANNFETFFQSWISDLKSLRLDVDVNYCAINRFPRWGTKENGVSTFVTFGVEVTASAIFLPGASQNQNCFSYQVRLRLLPTSPYTSVQLTHRHWIITDGSNVEEVEGEGVIGFTPILERMNEDEACKTDVSHGLSYAQVGEDTTAKLFFYASCTSFRSDRGSMRGSFRFVPGSRSDPQGHTFEAIVDEFICVPPALIE